jgi:hypothetical protein
MDATIIGGDPRLGVPPFVGLSGRRDSIPHRGRGECFAGLNWSVLGYSVRETSVRVREILQ